MRRIRKRSFEELVLENKQNLLKDQEALKKIEDRLEQRMINKAAE
ncbi:hypothetical protein FIU87_10180 [Bacillus sp. THAF10]|nr:FbpB family small basic protein [Bacillus sp. THAF10]QFT89013.1 hypothetical protein FIU87_10180 [Bacillus sp. THAF10]